MKKYLPLLIIIFILVLSFAGYYSSKKQLSPDTKVTYPETIEYTLEGKKVKLYVADTNEERIKGLMFYKDIHDIDGMLFVFEEKELVSMWNENTYIDLDIYWIDGEKVVGKSFLPSIESSQEVVTVHSPQSVDKAIELVRKK